MSHGKAYNVRIRVHNRLADAVVDQFGKDTIMVPYQSTRDCRYQKALIESLPEDKEMAIRMESNR